MLEAYLAGGYFCPKLLTFEPKAVTKIHPRAERSILRSGGPSSEALPGAVETHTGDMQAHPGNLEDHLIESWKLYLDHCDSSWRCRGSTWRHKASLISRGGYPWSRGGSTWSVEAHPGAMESRPESLWIILEP